jgi:hypothetical protein
MHKLTNFSLLEVAGFVKYQQRIRIRDEGRFELKRESVNNLRWELLYDFPNLD